MKVIDWKELEMLIGFWHLRYLTTAQVHRLWYGERTFEAAQKRLSRLGSEDVLKRVRFYGSELGWAWCLGSEGYRHLFDKRPGEWPTTKPLAPKSIQHLIVETISPKRGVSIAVSAIAGVRQFAWGSLGVDLPVGAS